MVIIVRNVLVLVSMMLAASTAFGSMDESAPEQRQPEFYRDEMSRLDRLIEKRNDALECKGLAQRSQALVSRLYEVSLPAISLNIGSSTKTVGSSFIYSDVTAKFDDKICNLRWASSDTDCWSAISELDCRKTKK